MTTPKEYGLNHDEWRPHQQDMVESVIDSDKKTVIVEAPTGSGKTTIPKAMSHDERTLALVKTKVLQQENYENGYGFTPIYGRANYDCVHPDSDPKTTASECLFAEEGMKHCDVVNKCPYVIQRNKAKTSKSTALNYAYWMHVHKIWPDVNNIICDEAHQIPETVLDWAGTTINKNALDEHNLPSFPFIRSLSGSNQEKDIERAVIWLGKIRTSLKRQEMESSSTKAKNRINRLKLKVDATIEAMKESNEGWFIKSGPGAGSDGKPAFIARPLSAKHHYLNYFQRDDSTTVLDRD